MTTKTRPLDTYPHSPKARTDFVKAFGPKFGPNFMTPTHIKTFYVNDYAVELSKGTGFSHNTIYGLTIVDTTTNDRFHPLNDCYDTLTEVEELLEEIRHASN